MPRKPEFVISWRCEPAGLIPCLIHTLPHAPYVLRPRHARGSRPTLFTTVTLTQSPFLKTTDEHGGGKCSGPGSPPMLLPRHHQSPPQPGQFRSLLMVAVGTGDAYAMLHGAAQLLCAAVARWEMLRCTRMWVRVRMWHRMGWDGMGLAGSLCICRGKKWCVDE